MESTTAGTSQLKVQVLNDHHCVICVLLWLGYAGGATKSEVCKCAPTCSLLVAVSTDELGLTLLMLPWNSMAALLGVKHCSLPAQRHQLRCVFDPSSQKVLFLPSQKT